MLIGGQAGGAERIVVEIEQGGGAKAAPAQGFDEPAANRRGGFRRDLLGDDRPGQDGEVVVVGLQRAGADQLDEGFHDLVAAREVPASAKKFRGAMRRLV